jgi:hypothetical protein
MLSELGILTSQFGQEWLRMYFAEHTLWLPALQHAEAVPHRIESDALGVAACQLFQPALFSAIPGRLTRSGVKV